jgi:hypothetical protein
MKTNLPIHSIFLTSGFVHDKSDPTGNTWWVSVWIGGLYKWNRNKLTLDENYEQVKGIKERVYFPCTGKRWNDMDRAWPGSTGAGSTNK